MNKPILIVDLDNTLLHSINKSHVDMLHISKFDHVFEINDYDQRFQKITYLSFERPGLTTFLEFCFKHFTVGVWTAANKNYATQIIQECFINKGFHPHFLFTNTETELSKFTHGGMKDINYLLEHQNLPLDTDVVIVDDNSLVANTNGNRCILCNPFYVYRSVSVTGNKTKLEFREESVNDTELEFVRVLLSTRFNLWV